MTTQTPQAEQFEAHRHHLQVVAYRMLGSLSEAEDAVQESWLRLSRADISDVDNLGGWLTTVASRVCLDMLRSRKTRREEPLDARLPDPIVSTESGVDPEHQALVSDAIGLALLVVLDALNPAERVAFVLHDMFGVPFDQIAPIVDRSPDAARMMASRARRRVQASSAIPDADLARQRKAVDAFHAASRGGGFDALIAVLDPDVVLRVDHSEGHAIVHGASAVASQALLFKQIDGPAPTARPALINGAAGIVTILEGRVHSVMAFTVVEGRVVEIDVIADRARLDRLGITA